MKIAVIDDSAGVVRLIVCAANEAGFEAIGLTAFGGGEIYDHSGQRSDLSVSEALEGIDVLFLDHDMPQNGDSMLREMTEEGYVSSGVRVIGISANHQPYLNENILCSNAYSPDFLKNLLFKA